MRSPIADQHVVAPVAEQDVLIAQPDQLVVPASSQHRVRARCPHEGVGAVRADEHVRGRRLRRQ